MAFQALYRRFRPQTFSAVIGQEHITTTLKNQVAGGRVSHAYLLCGSRGTGKTTTARILARAANCLAPADGEPCNACDACRSSAENSGDIIEIDAASNNGVDNVRQLIENAQYAPIHLQRRVFIIDEVHMLSLAAFNALLKTLEEPPPHILFILATTEPQKLPATIISRCQRYDFHRLTADGISKALQDILAAVGASIEDDGVSAIARAADGSMRDALSLADQCLAFCGNRVSVHDVYDMLGGMEEGFLFDMAGKLLGGDARGALQALAAVFHGGRDLTVFTGDMARHFRSLLLAHICGDCAGLLDCTPDAMRRYLDQAKDAPEARLRFALETLIAVQADMRYQAAPRALLEGALVRIARPADAQSLLALEARVAALEAAALTGEPAAPADKPAAPAKAPGKPAPASTEAAADKPAAPAGEPMAPANAPGKPAPASNAAASLWQAVLGDILRGNVMIHQMAKNGSALALDEETLTVGFPDTNASLFQSVSAAINHGPLQAALEARRPGLHLRLILTKIEPPSEETIAHAREVFGDSLIVE